MLITTVEQIKTKIVTIRTTLVSNAMETNDAHSMATNHHHQSTLDIPTIIADLKHNIATIALKTRAMYQKHMTLLLQNQP